MKRILSITATAFIVTALSAASTGSTPVFAQDVTTADEPMSKTCRVGPRSREVDIQIIEPFKVFDNLYHIGPCYVSVWVLTTPEGHILFDTAQEPFVDVVIDNIAKVGLDIHDIKYILINHGHTDHAGGAARFQALTGARVLAVEGDWPLIEALPGRPNNRDPEGRPNRVPPRDVVVHEGDTLDLGDQHLTLHTGPGHTPGVMVAEGIVVRDGNDSYNAVWGNAGGGGEGLAGAEQGVRNANLMASIEDIRVVMQTHAWQEPNGARGGGIHERAKLLPTRGPGDPNPFVDPQEFWEDRVAQAQENAQRRLAEEQARAQAN
jgi:metallo-beta-lactamase class B